VITSRPARRFGAAALAALFVCVPALPLAAAEATTLWGVVPETVRGDATQVVNEKVGGERVATLPAPTDGRFVFANITAGDYVVRLVDASGQTVAQSRIARVQPATATEARFDDQLGPGAAFPAGGSGGSKALVIVGAAALAGVGTAITLASDDDPRPASPSR
jgi:hypothetical protein